MTAPNDRDLPSGGDRHPYSPPSLEIFGSLSDLTSSGSNQASLDGGHGSKTSRSAL